MKTACTTGFWGVMVGLAVCASPACRSDSATPPSATNAVAEVPAVNDASSANTAETAEPKAKVPIQPPPLSAGVADIVDLAQKGVGDTVLIEYVRNSTHAFDLGADEILYLKDIGVSEEVIAEMLKRGRALAGQPDKTESGTSPAEPQPAATESTSRVASNTAPPAPEQPQPVQSTQSPTATQPQPGASSPPPVYTQPVTQVNNYFYSTLSPYGTWIDLPPYGWVWQPACAVVVTGWQPYSHGGYWVYTDAGWYWYSTYTWGWAPFHYGRWYRHHHIGWVWVPGYEWAPAWVTWRYTDLYCGWAPLPPGCGWSAGIGLTWYGSRVSFGFSFGLGWDHFTFVSYHNFCDRHVHRHRLPRHETTVVYNNSTVINNYVVGNNNTIINEGIPPKRISAVTRREIPKVRLHDVTSAPDGMHRADRLDPRGKQLAVYRPKAAPDATPPQPRPLRTSTVTRTTPAASLPASAGYNENRAPSGMSVRQPLRSRDANVSSAKQSIERTPGTTPQPARPARETQSGSPRLSSTSQTAKPGVLAPRQANDGSSPPTTTPPVRRSTVVRPEGSSVTGKPTQDRPAAVNPPATRIETRKMDSALPSQNTKPAQTDNRISVPRSTVSPPSAPAQPRSAPSLSVDRPSSQSSVTAPTSPPSMISRPKPTAPSTPVPSSSVQPTTRSSVPAATVPRPIVSQPPSTRPYSQPVSVPQVSAPPISSSVRAPSAPSFASPSASVPRAPVSSMPAPAPSTIGAQSRSAPAVPSSPPSTPTAPARSGSSGGHGRIDPR